MLALRPGRATHCVRCAHAVRTSAASKGTKSAARVGRSAVLLATPECAPGSQPRSRGCASTQKSFSIRNVQVPTAKGQGPRGKGPAAARLWCAEKHRAGGLARSANRQLTRRACLNAANAMSAVSCATRAARPSIAGQSVQRTDRTSEALPLAPGPLAAKSQKPKAGLNLQSTDATHQKCRRAPPG